MSATENRYGFSDVTCHWLRWLHSGLWCRNFQLCWRMLFFLAFSLVIVASSTANSLDAVQSSRAIHLEQMQLKVRQCKRITVHPIIQNRDNLLSFFCSTYQYGIYWPSSRTIIKVFRYGICVYDYELGCDVSHTLHDPKLSSQPLQRWRRFFFQVPGCGRCGKLRRRCHTVFLWQDLYKTSRICQSVNLRTILRRKRWRIFWRKSIFKVFLQHLGNTQAITAIRCYSVSTLLL